ncbi:hypothetical protein RND71_042452 [Anisodus tanguticus]|uniref:Uncharacterized protein n=1 Tax=Anisodus tanguticus TaxID=243964 RepID=A0AAE1QQZ3_9SOLA|nr:hypothetical protein RND71_042452 [Anisodus tanguticus]
MGEGEKEQLTTSNVENSIPQEMNCSVVAYLIHRSDFRKECSVYSNHKQTAKESALILIHFGKEMGTIPFAKFGVIWDSIFRSWIVTEF